jgi:hypothetical protein
VIYQNILDRSSYILVSSFGNPAHVADSAHGFAGIVWVAGKRVGGDHLHKKLIRRLGTVENE